MTRPATGQARSATERTVNAAAANTREVKNDKRPARLEDLTKAELYERAQHRDVPGRASMSKPQLIRALRSS